MRFDELGRVWTGQGQGGDPGAPVDLARVQDSGLRLSAQIRLRDGTETIVALLLGPVFVWLAVATPYLISRIGAGIIALCCLIIPLWFRAARRPPPDPGLPVADAVEAELARVQAQRNLLRRTAWWYAGPIWVGVTLFMIGPLPAWAAVPVAAGAAALMAWLVRHNHIVVRLQLDPWAEELEQAMREIEAARADVQT